MERDSGPGPLEKAMRKLEQAVEQFREGSNDRHVKVAGHSNVANTVNNGGKQTVTVREDGETEEVNERTETETS